MFFSTCSSRILRATLAHLCSKDSTRPTRETSPHPVHAQACGVCLPCSRAGTPQGAEPDGAGRRISRRPIMQTI
jgi:hypothetical protein